ncbi:DUF433 domain-containing protein [Verrucomicrobiales bacterium]|nr:DUF433 domain-containing protein [Verrucomicrobiales bacterium]
MSSQISSDPEILGGTPVFGGTRVPLRTLFDYLAAGDPLSEFLEDFPTVSAEAAKGVIIDAETKLEQALAS